MRVRMLTAYLAVLLGCNVIGCKSAPKMAWWKSSDDVEKVASTETRAAPELPSEVALEAGGLNRNDPLQISTAPTGGSYGNPASAAPAYQASSAAVGSYPNTGAPSYVPESNLAVTPQVPTSASNLPYDPNAVPAPRAVASQQASSVAEMVSAPVNPGVTGDRYTLPYTQPAAAPASASTSDYGMATSTTQPISPTGIASATQSSGALGNRYASQANSNAESAPQSAVAPQANENSVHPDTAVANTDTYRPGGTSTYPGGTTSKAAYEVASQSPGATASPPSSGTQNSNTQYR